MSKENERLDAAEGILFKKSLTVVLSTLYSTKLKNIYYSRHLPVAADAPSGATEIVWREYETYGQAKFIFDYSKDFPRADAGGREHSVKIYDIGAGYGWTIKEVRRTAIAGIPLTTIKASAAFRQIEEKLEQVASFGDTGRGLVGFFAIPGVNTAVPADSAANAGKKGWAYKTPAEILKDLNQLVTTVDDVTFQREAIDNVLMPVAEMQILKSTPFNAYSDKTIYTFWTENNPGIKLDVWPALKTAGTGGAPRLIGYVKDMDHLRFEIPVAFETFPEQLNGMEYFVPCHAETAGLIVIFPYSIVYADLINS